jgi:hypothetical protein
MPLHTHTHVHAHRRSTWRWARRPRGCATCCGSAAAGPKATCRCSSAAAARCCAGGCRWATSCCTPTARTPTSALSSRRGPSSWCPLSASCSGCRWDVWMAGTGRARPHPQHMLTRTHTPAPRATTRIQPVRFGREFALAATLYLLANSAVMNYFHVASHLRGHWCARAVAALLAHGVPHHSVFAPRHAHGRGAAVPQHSWRLRVPRRPNNTGAGWRACPTTC